MVTARSNPIVSALIRQYVYWSLSSGPSPDSSAIAVHCITPSRSWASFSQSSALLERRYVPHPSACILLRLFLAQLPSVQGKVSQLFSSALAVDPHFRIQYRDYHVFDLLQLPHDRVTKSRWIFGRWAHYNRRDVAGSSTKYSGCDHHLRKRGGCSHTRHRLFTMGCRNEIPIGEEKQC